MTEVQQTILLDMAVAADWLIRCVEYHELLIEKGSGHLSTADEEEIEGTDAAAIKMLRQQVELYRKEFPQARRPL